MNNEKFKKLNEKYKDRNLLEELFCNAHAENDSYISKEDNDYLNWLCNNSYLAIEKAIKDSKISSWIPVNVKLPDDDKEVLVMDTSGDVEIAFYYVDQNASSYPFEDGDDTGWCYKDGDPIIDEPIKWMPIPN